MKQLTKLQNPKVSHKFPVAVINKTTKKYKALTQNNCRPIEI